MIFSRVAGSKTGAFKPQSGISEVDLCRVLTVSGRIQFAADDRHAAGTGLRRTPLSGNLDRLSPRDCQVSRANDIFSVPALLGSFSIACTDDLARTNLHRVFSPNVASLSLTL